MPNHDFWKWWKNKTTTEKKAISAATKARNLVIRSVPKKALVAIYIKGSFARREMKEASDVDMVPIVTENKYEGNVFAVNCPEIAPVVVVPLSLWELNHNKLFTKGNYSPDLRAEPDLFLKKLKECRLIYGKLLNPDKFPMRESKEVLRSEINKIKNGYIPAYGRQAIDFQPLLKEVFWLVELEQKVKGKRVKHSFEGIVKSVKDKSHIVYSAFTFRKNLHKSKAEERKFILRLKRYIVELEKLSK